MKRPNLVILSVLFLVLVLVTASAYAAPIKPLTQVVSTTFGEVNESGAMPLPLITWGGDIATIYANGGSVNTKPDSLFGKKGLNFKLVMADNFEKQLVSYISGETAYLRGTMGMINQAAELLSDPRLQPIFVYQMTWSVGGDCMVVKQNINKVRDLKGKTIALQAYGPHVDYLSTLLKGAGLSMKDVNIVWTKNLTGDGDTPAKAFAEGRADAAMVIIPDGLALTSNGTTGTGAEGSVKGASILLSTKTANRVIADVYAVRADYLEGHRTEVENFVHVLLQSQDKVRGLFKNRNSQKPAYTAMLRADANIFFKSPDATADAESLFGDCEFVGYPGNEKFFVGDWARGFDKLTDEIQTGLISAGLLTKKVPMADAGWDWNKLKQGVITTAAPAARFNPVAAEAVANRRASSDDGVLFSFEIFFEPNQSAFEETQYEKEYTQVIQLAATYGGALVVVEGHSDPMNWLRRRADGASDLELNQIKQAAKNLSLTRAMAVRDSIIKYARDKGVSLDVSQFTVVGRGIENPRTGLTNGVPNTPKNDNEWRSNMRVVFKIIQIEAEASAFKPL